MIDEAETTRVKTVHLSGDPSGGLGPDIAIYADGELIAPAVAWTPLGVGIWSYSYTTPASGTNVDERITGAGLADAIDRAYRTVAFTSNVGVAITPTLVLTPRSRYEPTTLPEVEKGTAPADTILIFDANEEAVDLRGLTLRMVFYRHGHDGKTAVHQYTTAGRLSVGATEDDKHQLTVAWHADDTATPGELSWALLNVGANVCIGRGTVPIIDVPSSAPPGGGE